MNQTILFSDNERYNSALEQVEFEAQCQGALVTCVISVDNLFQLNEKDAKLQDTSETEILSLFESSRFDIEDIAEQLINDQRFNEDGKVYLLPLYTTYVK